MVIVIASFEKKEHAEQMANILIDKGLAACVSLIPVQSFYYWNGEKNIVQEYEALIKTKDEKFSEIEKEISTTLGYEIPQLIQLSTGKVNKQYLNWLNNQVK